MSLRNHLFFLLPWLLLTANTSAPTGHSNSFRPGKDFALFFAVNNYDQWDDLSNPISDVEAIAKDLKDLFGFETEIVRNPDRKTILDKIEVYRQKVYDKDAQLLIFLSGHGEFNEATKQGYFVPKNGLKNDVYGDSYIEYEGLKRRISSLPCEHILLALDACYSGTANESIAMRGGPGKRPGANADTERERYISTSLQYKTRIMLTSGAKVRTPDKSQFVAKFLQALRSQGGDDRLINTPELLGYLTTAIPKPVLSTFSDHEPGGEFLFVVNNDTARTFTPPADITDLNVAQDGMVLVRGGTFQMGSNGNKNDEKPVHSVTISDFYLGKHEVTNAEYCLFLNEKGNQSEGGVEWINLSGNYDQEKCRILQIGKQFSVEAAYDNYPVIYISWYGAKAYCDWLTEKKGKKNSGYAYRLPTEAEWEYAAGNGSKHTRYSWGNGDPNGRSGGNIADASAAKILDASSVFRAYNDGFVFGAPVGSYNSNEFGIFDMTGNVREWCSDWYAGDYYATSPFENPPGPSQTIKKITRGGSWLTLLKDCGVASRSGAEPETSTCDIGFRIVQPINY
ncbi:MAG TPA: SUMF1/EgtB/PvdO family nonheme iron enzyme [Saprospiraceae bacterium]|nr:SUMF1/EgtB/PvdO family nonheme iron enzyme [Saprospiraceae bacterium]